MIFSSAAGASGCGGAELAAGEREGLPGSAPHATGHHRPSERWWRQGGPTGVSVWAQAEAGEGRQPHPGTLPKCTGQVYESCCVTAVFFEHRQMCCVIYLHQPVHFKLTYFPHSYEVAVTFDLWPPISSQSICSRRCENVFQISKESLEMFLRLHVQEAIKGFVSSQWPLTSKIESVHPLFQLNL